MSLQQRRAERCANAIEDVLCFLRRSEREEATMHRLMLRFASPAGILEASQHELCKEDLKTAEAQLLSLMPGLTRYIARSAFGEGPRLDNVVKAAAYLKALYIGLPIEQFYLLCLDASGRLIEVRRLQSGTIDETPFYLGSVLQCVVDSGAFAVVLSHNHPGGTLYPSDADLRCTNDAERALKLIGIRLVDHIIIADGQAVSFRQNGYLTADPAFNDGLSVRWLG